jgi:hypothetical protein
MAPQDSRTTRLNDYITCMLPWAHGHQRKGLGDFVTAIIDQQSGCQAQLARAWSRDTAPMQSSSKP